MMTKTLIDIDDVLLARAVELTGAATKKAVVHEALAQLVRQREAVAYIDLVRTGIVIDLDAEDVTGDAQR